MSLQLINQVLELTNEERTKAGLDPLKLNDKLANAADDHSDSMAQDDFFSHTGADGSSVSDRVESNGYQYSTVGENIAAGQTTAQDVVQSWMDSPGHRANILNADYTEIGIGYEFLENDTGSVNYNHYWTQVFGTSLNNNSEQDTDIEEVPVIEAQEEAIDDNSTPEVEAEIVDLDSEDNSSVEEIIDNNEVDLDSLELDNAVPEEVVENEPTPENNLDLDNSEVEIETEADLVIEEEDTVEDLEIDSPAEANSPSDSNQLEVDDLGGESIEVEDSLEASNWELDDSVTLEDSNLDYVTGNSGDLALTGGSDLNFSNVNESFEISDHNSLQFDNLLANSWLGSWIEDLNINYDEIGGVNVVYTNLDGQQDSMPENQLSDL